MHIECNLQMAATRPFMSWADRTFNPWLSWSRSLGCVGGETSGLYPDAEIGDARMAKSWNANAQAFALKHDGRRQRVFAGPWCHALAANVDEAQRARFWSLVRATPALDWLVLASGDVGRPATLPADWGYGYHNVWVGAKATGPESARFALAQLKGVAARLRFLVATPMRNDFGDLDLSGVDWVIVGADTSDLVPADWVMSVKLQAMCDGVPVWMESPHSARLGGLESAPYAVQEHPRL